jgi:hypothetical protein
MQGGRERGTRKRKKINIAICYILLFLFLPISPLAW